MLIAGALVLASAHARSQSRPAGQSASAGQSATNEQVPTAERAAAVRTARVAALTVGRPLARDLRGGETQRFSLTLDADQFLQVQVTPRDIDVAVTLTGPTGGDPLSVDLSPDLQTTETIVAIAEARGRYQLAVSAPNARALAGRYTIRVEAIHPATERDRVRVRARRALEAGGRLRVKGGTVPLREAETQLQEALVRLRETGDRDGEAAALFLLAWTAMDRATPDTVERGTEALAAARALGDRLAMAKAASMLGAAYERKGELAQGLAAMSESIALSEAIGSRVQEARTRLALSVLYGRSGDAERGIEQSRQALRLFRALRIRGAEMTALNNMGIAAKDLGDMRLSMQYYEEGLAIARSLGERIIEAGLLNNLGNLYRDLGEFEKALASHRDALTLAREVGNEEHEARALNTLGMTYRRLGEYQKALDYHEQSLAIRQRRSDLAAQAATHDGMGQAWHALGHYDRAIEQLNEALRIRHQIAERYSETSTLRHLAQVERDRGNLAAALAHVEASVALTDSLRGLMASPELRVSFVAAAQEQYELHVDVLMQMHRHRPTEGFEARALEASERGRARVLLESLQRGVKLEDPRFASLTQARTLTATEIQRELLDRDTILLEFTLGTQRSWLWTVGADTLAGFDLPPRHEIETAARRIYALLTARQPRAGESSSRRAARLAVADAAWRQESAAFAKTLVGPAAAHFGDAWRGKRLLIVAAGVLEYMPFSALPDPATTDPDPAADLASAGRALVADHEIVHLPSASVLAVMRRDSDGRPSAAKRLAVLADPVFEASDPRVTVTARRDRPATSAAAASASSAPASAASASASAAAPDPVPSATAGPVAFALATRGAGDASGAPRRFARLPFSRQEAHAVSAFVPAAERLAATDFQASRATAMNPALSDYRIVHFATHGLLDSERPELSGLVFSLVGRDGRTQDGFLRLRDIYSLRLPADVVVLSACQTALGTEIKGEGLIGLTRGFMHAGARRVVASLWQVDDLATAELMRVFYRGMVQEGLRPAAALRAAQRELSTQARWASPYYWSAFVLQGEWK